MLLIPGLTSPGSVWRATVEHFQSRYTCHVLTVAGFAGVPATSDPSLRRVRDDLVDYITRHRLANPVLVGHSIGGLLAYWVATTIPDRVGPIVSIEGPTWMPAVFDTTASADKAARAAEGIRRSIAAMSPAQFRQVSDRMLAGQVRDSVARAWLAPIAASSDPGTTAALLADAQITDLRAVVAAIRTPVLLFVGTHGIAPEARAAYVASARRQLANAPNVAVVELADARHFVHLDAPAAFLASADSFLSRVRRP
jgi:pimeloyl-ACP methyl ester carboxylesterase